MEHPFDTTSLHTVKTSSKRLQVGRAATKAHPPSAQVALVVAQDAVNDGGQHPLSRRRLKAAAAEAAAAASSMMVVSRHHARSLIRKCRGRSAPKGLAARYLTTSLTRKG